MLEEIKQLQTALKKTESDIEALKADLAKEKSDKAEAQADLDALKTKKPDTSEADALRKELQALNKEHQAALTNLEQELAKATKEHGTTKDALAQAQAEADEHKAVIEKSHQTSQADYKDLHDSMAQLVEEANKKAADKEALVAELEANLKVKDAEIAELKVCSECLYLIIFIITCYRPKPLRPAPLLKPQRASRQASSPATETLNQHQQLKRKVSTTVHQQH